MTIWDGSILTEMVVLKRRKARSYWQKALKINNEDDYALYYLGILYKYGYGVDIALGKAYKFLTKSADLGNDDAKKEVADLEMHHTSAELFMGYNIMIKSLDVLVFFAYTL